jgi:hypothetical protein
VTARSERLVLRWDDSIEMGCEAVVCIEVVQDMVWGRGKAYVTMGFMKVDSLLKS